MNSISTCGGAPSGSGLKGAVSLIAKSAAVSRSLNPDDLITRGLAPKLPFFFTLKLTVTVPDLGAWVGDQCCFICVCSTDIYGPNPEAAFGESFGGAELSGFSDGIDCEVVDSVDSETFW